MFCDDCPNFITRKWHVRGPFGSDCNWVLIWWYSGVWLNHQSADHLKKNLYMSRGRDALKLRRCIESRIIPREEPPGFLWFVFVQKWRIHHPFNHLWQFWCDYPLWLVVSKSLSLPFSLLSAFRFVAPALTEWFQQFPCTQNWDPQPAGWTQFRA